MSLITEVVYCSNCLAMSTRPRITFDERGFCNACRWMEAKKNIDWGTRQAELKELLAKHKRSDGYYDCLVPVSGGKDGSYVAYNLKHKYGMNPLCITVTPQMQLDIGERNLKSFIASGYDHIAVNANPDVMRLLDKTGFVEKGFPYYGWLIAIHSAPVNFAIKMGINLIFYGEDGEVEYGGTNETENNAIYDVEYMKNVYLDGGYEKVLAESGIAAGDLNFYSFDHSVDGALKLDITHWSYFENWDPYRNYLLAKEKCGLIESESNNSGTFTNFAQNDQALYALHTYLMYLKFGFGRANQDACIEVRRGAMDRSQAVQLVRLYDGLYPEEYISDYLEYYQMTIEDFNDVIDNWANKEIFEKVNGRWSPKFEVV